MQEEDAPRRSILTQVIRDTAVSVASSPSPRSCHGPTMVSMPLPYPSHGLETRPGRGMDYRVKPGNDDE